ncbi:histidine phosphatase family protein [Anaerosporobacter sp.]|uniref:histidine phosphatase family protein n=1 Tax=Anaerosporobacter sp. TaxID=1872529 RepID=UPI00286F61F8|nr:histidine phosphatase family protein [Anaerosporobacter sp.]
MHKKWVQTIMIYLVRQGQTDWNLFKRCNGITETFLNQTGIVQSELQSQKLKARSALKMYEVFIEYSDMLDKSNYKKILDFLIPKCTELTYYVILQYYYLTAEDLTKAIEDLTGEVDKEKFQDHLLKLKKSNEMALIKYEELDGYEETEPIIKDKERIIKELRWFYSIQKPITPPPTNVKNEGILPETSFIDSTYTQVSHCTFGGLYKEFRFRLDENLIAYLYNTGDLIKFNTFKNLEWLEDPVFYNGEEIKCAISSHERNIAFFLKQEEYEAFKLLNIPMLVNSPT